MSTMVRRLGRHRGRPRRSLIGLLVMALLIGAGAVAFPFLTAPQSHAAAGDPFNPADPQVFVAQEVPTRLYRAVTGASGSVTFQPEGPASTYQYNAISYNTANNYLYGISAGNPVGAILRIGQGGVVTRVGTGVVAGVGTNWGAFAPDGSLYVGTTGQTTAYRVNVTTGQVAATITLTAPMPGADITYADGYFWTVDNNGSVVRVDLLGATKTVTTFPTPVLPPGGYGAAWTFGNGNTGFSENGTGTVYQIKITNPAAANPTFTRVSTSPGPASGNNDGAASPGLPTDLSVVKSGPDMVKPGTTVTYTLKVKNNGPGNSSGYTVTDTVPAPLTNVKTSTPGCTVAGNTVTCVGGRTLAGVENTITVTADAPATMTGCVTNTGSVLANEQDPTAGNNQSSVKTCAVVPSLTVEKSATPGTVSAVGESVKYSFVLTNTGNVELSNPGVTETAFSGSTPPAVDCPAGPLAPGGSLTCTATYTVTQSDLDAGSIKNTATAHGTAPGDTTPTVSQPDSATVTATSSPGLKVVKSATTSRPDKLVLGEQITYDFVVTNTGNVTLKDVKVTETTFTGAGTPPVPACPTDQAAALAPGAEMTCTATYTVTQADVDAGSIKNIATGTGNPPTGPPPVSPPSEVTVPSPSDPALTVVKTASTGKLVAGEKVTYSFRITNTGNVTLKDAKVTETAFTGSGTLDPVSCPSGAASLAPGASVTCTATYTVTQADVDAGSVKNTATATGTPPTGPPPVSPPSEVTITQPPAPAMTVAKSATSSRPDTLVLGETITYKFEVKNTGNVTLKDVKVTEGEFTGSGTLSPVTCPTAEAAALAPGATMTCTATYTVTQADVDAGSIKNSATTTGTPPTGPPPVSPPGEVTVPAPSDPKLTVVKSASTGKLVAGEQITYSFAVTNTGNVTLKDVKITEGEFTGTGTLSPVTCPTAEAASLAPGATVTCTATYTVTQADVDAGSVKNSATATGTPPSGPPPVSPPSEVTITTPDEPGLSVVKSASTGTLVKGEEIVYKFEVKNTGNVTLKDVKVTEGPFTGSGTLSPVTCPSGAATLAPGAVVTCTATYTVTQADVDAGSVKNSATATGTPPRGEPPVSPPSETTVSTQDQPGLSVVKTGHSSKPDELLVGEQIRYDFTVTNTGNVTLKDVKVTEGEFTGTGTPPVATCPTVEAAALAPGATMTCTATYTVTQADVDAGSVKNSATATGTPPRGEPPVSPPSETIVPAPEKPALAVVKTSSTDKLVAGEQITYSFAVTNTGNVTLKDVKITEGEFTGHGKLDPVTCPKEAVSLAPGATVLCTAAYTVTQADVDAGSVKNSATATGTPPRGEPPVSPPSETTVTTDDRPGLSVVKSASTGQEDKLVAGEKITYSFTARNTGNVTLKDIKINEGEFTGHGKLDPVTCPSGAVTLAPGATVTCTAGYTVTQADVDAGSVKNTATATGTPPRGEPPVSPPSEVELPQQPKPSLAVVKSAETEKPGRLVKGEKITYRFAVTNTGNVTVKDVKVDEGEFTGTGKLSAVTCPKDAATLAPGATVTCTATYTVTQADVDAGTIRNTATATGTPPGGEPPVSPPSEVTVPSGGRGALGLTKTADVVDANGNGKTDVGDRIEWKLTVANQGTATVTGIKVDDPTAGQVTCPRTSLAPGETMVCTTQPHTITTEDARRGKVVNTATATGPGATPSEATATVKVAPGNPPAPVPADPKPSGPTGILAHTGTAVLTVVAIAGALLVIGGLVLGLSRRRRNH